MAAAALEEDGAAGALATVLVASAMFSSVKLLNAMLSLSSADEGVDAEAEAEDALPAEGAGAAGGAAGRDWSDRSLRWTVIFRVWLPETRYGTV